MMKRPTKVYEGHSVLPYHNYSGISIYISNNLFCFIVIKKEINVSLCLISRTNWIIPEKIHSLHRGNFCHKYLKREGRKNSIWGGGGGVASNFLHRGCTANFFSRITHKRPRCLLDHLRYMKLVNHSL